jgi:peptidoglycan/LPS O-acetylase OafA/YrhL
MESKERAPRISVVDLLRGVASFSVLLFHLVRNTPGLETTRGPLALHAYGSLGVQVFFVISGFILLFALARSRFSYPDYRTFVWKRIVRLDPPYLVTVAGAILLAFPVAYFTGQAVDLSPGQVLSHLGYVVAFTEHRWLVPVFWTLAIEFQFYLLVALLYPLLTSRHALARFGTVAVFCASAFLFSRAGAPDDKPIVFQHAGLFALGIATYWWHARMIRLPVYLAVVLAISLQITGTVGPAACAAALLTAAAIAAAPAARGPRVLVYLGTISYSLYLVHQPVGYPAMFAVKRLLGEHPLPAFAAGLASSLIAAHLLWRFVEVPAQRWSSAIRFRHAGALSAFAAPQGGAPPVEADARDARPVAAG